MNARLKLNAAVVNAIFIFSGLAGWYSGSWLMFVAVLVVLLGTSLHSGDIRSTPRSRH